MLYQPIRIRLLLTEEEAYHLTPNQRSYLLEQIAAPAARAWSLALRVVPVTPSLSSEDGQEGLTVDRSQLYDGVSCGPGLNSGLPSVRVPEDHFRSGVDGADLVVYLSVSFRLKEEEEDESTDEGVWAAGEDDNADVEERHSKWAEDKGNPVKLWPSSFPTLTLIPTVGSSSSVTSLVPTPFSTTPKNNATAPTRFNATSKNIATEENNNTVADDGNASTVGSSSSPSESPIPRPPPPPLPTCPFTTYLASASYCSTDQHDRPIAGLLHLCVDPDKFFPSEPPGPPPTAEIDDTLLSSDSDDDSDYHGRTDPQEDASRPPRSPRQQDSDDGGDYVEDRDEDDDGEPSSPEDRRIRREFLRRLAVRTIVHELGHVLGFNSQSLAHFRDPVDGAPLTPRDESGNVRDVRVECTGPADPEWYNEATSGSRWGGSASEYSMNSSDPSLGVPNSGGGIDGGSALTSRRRYATLPLPSESTLRFREVRGGVRVAEVVTETVRRVTRNRFDCDFLDGAELESGRGVWERESQESASSDESSGGDGTPPLNITNVTTGHKAKAGYGEIDDKDEDRTPSQEKDEMVAKANFTDGDGKKYDKGKENDYDNKWENLELGNNQDKESEGNNVEGIKEGSDQVRNWGGTEGSDDVYEGSYGDNEEYIISRVDNRTEGSITDGGTHGDADNFASETVPTDVDDDGERNDDEQVGDGDDRKGSHIGKDNGNEVSNDEEEKRVGTSTNGDTDSVVLVKNDKQDDRKSGADDYEAAQECIGNHWERRLFKTDIMNPIIDPPDLSDPSFNDAVALKISSLTLAYFADSGWYRINPTRAEPDGPGTWGRAAGCDFVEEKCLTDQGRVTASNAQFFCGDNGGAGTSLLTRLADGGNPWASAEVQGCSADLTRKAMCGMTVYGTDIADASSVPPEFRYFSNVAGFGPGVGGTDPDLDFCPTYTGFFNGLCAATIKSNQDGGGGYYDLSVTAETTRVHTSEEFSLPKSRCVVGRVGGKQTGLCLLIACVKRDRTLHVKVDGIWKLCEFGGQMHRLSPADYVVCPDPRKTCPTFYCPRDCLAFEGSICDYKTGKCMCPKNLTKITVEVSLRNKTPTPTIAPVDPQIIQYIQCGTEDSKGLPSNDQGYGDDFSLAMADESFYSAYYVEDATELKDTPQDPFITAQKAFERMSAGEIMGFITSALVILLAVGMGSTYVYKASQIARSRAAGRSAGQRRRRRDVGRGNSASLPRMLRPASPEIPLHSDFSTSWSENGDVRGNAGGLGGLSSSLPHSLQQRRFGRPPRDPPWDLNGNRRGPWRSDVRSRKDKVVASMLVNLRVHDPRVIRRLERQRLRRLVRERMRLIYDHSTLNAMPHPLSRDPTGKNDTEGKVAIVDPFEVKESEAVVRRSELPPLPNGERGRVIAVVGARFVDDIQGDGDGDSSVGGFDRFSLNTDVSDVAGGTETISGSFISDDNEDELSEVDDHSNQRGVGKAQIGNAFSPTASAVAEEITEAPSQRLRHRINVINRLSLIRR